MRPERNLRPSDEEALKRSLARLDVATLVERGTHAIEEGDREKATLYLRTAVRRAPLRQDLRDLLVAAAEMGGERGGRAAPAPQPLPRSPRRPLFDEEPEDDDERPEIEEIRLSDEDTQEIAVLSEETIRVPGLARTRPIKKAPPKQDHRSRYQERHERGPTSAIIIGMGVAALLLTGAAVGVVWYYYEHRVPLEKQAAGEPRKDQRVERDRDLIDRSKGYEQQSQFAMAIEQLELLSDTPEKKKLLSEAYGRQGDYYTFHNRYNEAREAYQRALEHDAKNSQFAFDLGATLYQLGRHQQSLDHEAAAAKYAEAERSLKAALELKPAYPEALARLADIEIARGNPPTGAEYLRRIIQSFPQSKEADRAQKTLETMGLKP